MQLTHTLEAEATTGATVNTPPSFPLSNVIDNLPTILIIIPPGHRVYSPNIRSAQRTSEAPNSTCLEIATGFTGITVILKIALLEIHASMCTPACHRQP